MENLKKKISKRTRKVIKPKSNPLMKPLMNEVRIEIEDIRSVLPTSPGKSILIKEEIPANDAEKNIKSGSKKGNTECHICGKILSSIYTLAKHVVSCERKSKKEKKIYKCLVCDKVYQRSDAVKTRKNFQMRSMLRRIQLPS